MSAPGPVILVHLEDQARPGRRLCDGDWLQLVMADVYPTMPRETCPGCELRKRELAGHHPPPAGVDPAIAVTAAAEQRRLRDEHPAVAQLQAAMGPSVEAMTRATVDAAVLGTGWIRIRMCPVHGPELTRIDPALVIVSEETSS